MIISAVTAAAEENGLACWIKHFVLNDQETNRNGYSLFTWGDEQTFRENYFMYPQKAMQEGGSQGYMQSFARIGGVVFAYSYEANTELVRNQWGLDGYRRDRHAPRPQRQRLRRSRDARQPARG